MGQMIRMCLSALAAFLMLAQGSVACKTAVPLETYSMEQTVQEAPFAVYGRYEYDYIQGTDENPASRNIVFKVYCILKTDGTVVANNITLDGKYMWHSCFHTDLEVGIEYILSLNKEDGQAENVFRVYEPNVASKGGFPATKENLEKAVSLCSLRNVSPPQNALENKCPTVVKSSDDCNEAPPPPTYSPSGSGCLLSVSVMSSFVYMVSTIFALY